uniref:Synaptotagmin-like protein 1 n=1 Tax=Oncorhynchus mykiss TaxID=8022 RepID=A0A8C7TRY8_ONCMY
MEGEGELLDLSHLSEAEQTSILEVLLRDSNLRCLDEGRVRTLQQKEANPVRLRLLSGAWFHEERSKRYRDTKDGVDIVQASIRGRNGSMMSLFSSGEFGAVEVKGRVLFSLDYDTQREELQVKVCRCEGLVAARKNHSDPYAKAYLLPDKSSHSKKKTTVKRKTLNPVFDQTLKVRVRGRTLNLSVWHAASLGRNLFLGEVELELAHWDWTHTDPDWYKLQPRLQCSPESISSRGNIMLSIKFTPAGSEGGGLPPSGEIHIWLRQAQGLLSTKGGAIDSFVESYVLPDAGRSSGQKTRVVKRSVSPIYNHTMVYEGFKPADLREACTELTVWHREGIKTHLLGGVRLSPGTGLSYGAAVCWMDSTEEEVTMWTSMILNPSHWIDTTLPIRTNLVNRQN